MTNAFDQRESLFDIDDIDHISKQAETPSKQMNDSSQTVDILVTYVAHYTSPHNEEPTKGFFEFQSAQRALSKKNLKDARIKMLEIFGKQAVSWIIDDVHIKKKETICSEQIELDFRKQKPVRKKPKIKKYL